MTKEMMLIVIMQGN